MYFRKNNVRKETYKWRVEEILYARRIADTNRTMLEHLVPQPEGVKVEVILPEWCLVPFCRCIPCPSMAPKGAVQFTRGIFGHHIVQRSNTFELSDPYGHDMKLEYEQIHDPLLKDFLASPYNVKYFGALNVLTEDNKVKSTLKSYNAYRHFMWALQRRCVKEQLIENETTYEMKQKFCKFVAIAGRVQKQALLSNNEKRGAIDRKFLRWLCTLLVDILRKLRRRQSDACTRKVKKTKDKKWMIHTILQERYPSLVAEYINRAYWIASRKRIIFMSKNKRQRVWETKRDDIIERCRKLKNALDHLKWNKKIVWQGLAMKRDFIILNDFQSYSTRRMRNRAIWYHLDRLAMKRKFERLRWDKDFKPFYRKMRSRLNYSVAADFLMNTRKLPPVIFKPHELVPEKRVVRRPIRRHRKIRPIQLPLLRRSTRDCAPKKTGHLVHTVELGGILFAENQGNLFSRAFMEQVSIRYVMQALKAYTGIALSKCMRDLRCFATEMRHRRSYKIKSPEELAYRYNWSKKLPYKAVSENWDPKIIVKRKLIFAVRRYMKHERRRLRATRQFPEWSYYDKPCAKHRSKRLITLSNWRELKLYYALITEQYETSNWKKNSRSLGRYLLYILVNHESFTDKKKKVTSNLTLIKAIILKLKTKIRIVIDIIRRIAMKKIRFYYPSEIHNHVGTIVRGHIKKLLPKDPSDGDRFFKGLTTLIGCTKLKYITFQHIAPLSDKLLLNVCFTQKFPLRFNKYRVDLHNKEWHFEGAYAYRHPLANLDFKEKVRKVIEFRKHENNKSFLVESHLPRLEKYMKYFEEVTYSKYMDFK